MMTGLECCHSYCTTCWTQYLSAKIMDEGASQSIECPEFNCNILVDDQTVMRLVKDSRTKLKYQHLITNSFVQVSFKILFGSILAYLAISCSVIVYYDGALLPTAPMLSRCLPWRPNPSNVGVAIHSALHARKIGMTLSVAIWSKSGSRNATMTQRRPIGSPLTPKSVQPAEQLLKKMEVVTTWFAKIKPAKRTFVGFVLVPGSLTEAPGTTVIGEQHLPACSFRLYSTDYMVFQQF